MTDESNHLTVPKRHSRLGIASVIIAVALPLLLTFFVILGILLSLNESSREEAKLVNEIMGNLMLTSLTFPVIHLVGLILGIAALFSKKTKKLFPVAGIILNALLIFLGVAIAAFLISALAGVMGPR